MEGRSTEVYREVLSSQFSRRRRRTNANGRQGKGVAAVAHSADEVLIATTKRGFDAAEERERGRERKQDAAQGREKEANEKEPSLSSSFFQGEAAGRLTTSSINLGNFRRKLLLHYRITTTESIMKTRPIATTEV